MSKWFEASMYVNICTAIFMIEHPCLEVAEEVYGEDHVIIIVIILSSMFLSLVLVKLSMYLFEGLTR